MPDKENYQEYFSNRGVEASTNYKLPKYLLQVLPPSKTASILDVGCGLGYAMQAIKELGYSHVQGIDISNQALAVCRQKGLQVQEIEGVIAFAHTHRGPKFDFIIMSHVLEHIAKDKIIETLTAIREYLLNSGGKIIIMVPNAQSNTGCYWAYEDFTHYTLFTSGSLEFVLKNAGFFQMVFLDPDGTLQTPFPFKLIKKILLLLYKFNYWFWNHVTLSSFHKPSRPIFTFELKVLATKE